MNCSCSDLWNQTLGHLSYGSDSIDLERKVHNKLEPVFFSFFLFFVMVSQGLSHFFSFSQCPNMHCEIFVCNITQKKKKSKRKVTISEKQELVSFFFFLCFFVSFFVSLFLFSLYCICPIITYLPLPSSLNPSPGNLHTVVHVHESSYCFLKPSTPPTPIARAVILFCIYETFSVLHVSSDCSLDSTYQWNHVVFIILWLAYFT